MSKIIIHIPHSSKLIPEDIRKDIKLSDEELNKEINIVTDLYTDKIFNGEDVMRFKYSRLVCDVERFSDDRKEIMSRKGMGAVYTVTSQGKVLREITKESREDIIEKYYKPYHKKLSLLVESKLEEYEECFIIDCHSFNTNVKHIKSRDIPDICLGLDEYHTPKEVVYKLRRLFEGHGYTVGINVPFSGSMVPLDYHNMDNRVSTVMIELNRDLYIEGESGINLKRMNKLIDVCNKAIKLIADL